MLRDIEKYYRPLVGDENFDVRKFSGFVELQKPGVKQAILETGFSLTNFSEWIRDEKIGTVAIRSSAASRSEDERAKRVFLADGMEEALKLLDRPHLNEALEEADLSQLARGCAKLSTLFRTAVQSIEERPAETTVTYSKRQEMLERLIQGSRLGYRVDCAGNPRITLLSSI